MLVRIVLGSTSRGAVDHCPEWLVSVDGSTSSPVAADYHWLTNLNSDAWHWFFCVHGSQISPFLCCHPTYQTMRAPLPRYQNNRLHYLWQQYHFMNPWNIYPKMPTFSLNHLNNYCWNFQILPGILLAKKKEATEYDYHYQLQHISEATKVFKYISECIFHRTQLMAMHNTVMTSNTNGVPPSETHMQFSFMQCRTTNCQPVKILR